MELTPLKYFDSLYPANTREKEIHALIPFIQKGLSSQIIGVPGVGKSNILRLLAYNRDVRTKHFGRYEALMHFVYIDSTEIKGRPLSDITKFILLSLSFSLGERRMMKESEHINKLLKEGVALNDEMMLFSSLKKALDYLLIEKKLTIHLLFDKFEAILPEITPQFFANLRILRNHAKYRFASVFSLNRPINEIADPLLISDFHDLVSENEIYVSLYDPIGIKFRLDYIEKAARKNIPQKTREEIIKLTGGHAKLSKLAFEALISETENIENLQELLLKRSTIDSTLHEIWSSLLPSEQIVFKGMSFSEIKENHSYLTLSGLISEKGIMIPIFEEFLRKIPVETYEKITYDSSLNEIFMGTTKISENLSPSEFRLLK